MLCSGSPNQSSVARGKPAFRLLNQFSIKAPKCQGRRHKGQVEIRVADPAGDDPDPDPTCEKAKDPDTTLKNGSGCGSDPKNADPDQTLSLPLLIIIFEIFLLLQFCMITLLNDHWVRIRIIPNEKKPIPSPSVSITGFGSYQNTRIRIRLKQNGPGFAAPMKTLRLTIDSRISTMRTI